MTPTMTPTEEVVTHTPVQDVRLPGGAGTLALLTLDNGHDHTRPNTFGPATIAGLQTTLDTLRGRAEAAEIRPSASPGSRSSSPSALTSRPSRRRAPASRR